MMQYGDCGSQDPPVFPGGGVTPGKALGGVVEIGGGDLSYSPLTNFITQSVNASSIVYPRFGERLVAFGRLREGNPVRVAAGADLGLELYRNPASSLRV